MKVTREKANQNRAAIVAAAEQLFRAKGFDGVGIADITRAAGLTHGGFYGHFASKDALAAEACALSFAESLERMAARARSGGGGIKAYIDAYLSPAHVTGTAPRCPMAAFSSDIVRQDGQVQARFAEGVADYIAAMAAMLPQADAQARHDRATTLLCTLVGALSLARAVAGSDPAAADALLEQVRSDLIALADAPAPPSGDPPSRS